MIFSSTKSLDKIKNVLWKYARLPFFEDAIPGAVLEGVLAYVLDAEVLKTYDFIDVYKKDSGCGWQVKSTKETTPVTWKRAKIPNSLELIEASQKNTEGLQNLGDAIIQFCNNHAFESLETYDLLSVGYSRLILHKNLCITYFERELCTRENPKVFEESDYIWKWSNPKKTKKKEQLPALHGIYKETGDKHWAWHGLGENQLHFSGEKFWWDHKETQNVFKLQLPTANDKLSFEEFFDLLGSSSKFT